jgi:fumarate reductase subunit D
LEVTFLAKCIRGTDRIIAISNNNKLKVVIYTCFAASLWCSLLQFADTILIAAITLTAAAGFYGFAVIRGEEPTKSNVVTQDAVARTVLSRV